jgi:Sulfotransferase family
MRRSAGPGDVVMCADREREPRPPAPAVTTRGAPVIVLAYRHGGAERLRAVLAGHPDLACTSGTGILPLCEQAAAAWRTVDGPLPKQAAGSIRALAASLITTVLTREGKRRWCEVATVPPHAVGAFCELFPETRVLCLHRSCPGACRAALRASPWSLAGAAFAPFTAAYPGSPVAALAAYWVMHTGALLRFEQAHPRQCRRVRYEDLAAAPPPGLFAFLGLAGPPATAPAGRAAGGTVPALPAGPAPAFPAGQFPAPLLTQVNGLGAELGYPPLADRAP